VSDQSFAVELVVTAAKSSSAGAGDLDRAPHPTTMTQIRGRGRAELGPRQCLAPTEQAALVALYREHVVPTAPGDVGGGRGLGARRVRSDHRRHGGPGSGLKN